MGFVQAASNNSATSSVAVPFAADNTAGDILIAFGQVAEPFAGLTGMSVSDSQGNTWISITAPAEQNNYLVGAWIAVGCKPGPNTVTLVYGYGAQPMTCTVLEFSGVSALDAHAAVSASSVASLTTSVTTAQTGDLLVALGLNSSTGAALDTAAGFTQISTYNTGSQALTALDMIAGGAGSYSATVGPGHPVNYSSLFLLAFTPVALTAQTITFPGISNHSDTDAPFGLAATSDSGLAVSYSVVSGPATVAGSTVTLTGGDGVVTIQATQAGNGT